MRYAGYGTTVATRGASGECILRASIQRERARATHEMRISVSRTRLTMYTQRIHKRVYVLMMVVLATGQRLRQRPCHRVNIYVLDIVVLCSVLCPRGSVHASFAHARVRSHVNQMEFNYVAQRTARPPETRRAGALLVISESVDTANGKCPRCQLYLCVCIVCLRSNHFLNRPFLVKTITGTLFFRIVSQRIVYTFD